MMLVRFGVKSPRWSQDALYARRNAARRRQPRSAAMPIEIDSTCHLLLDLTGGQRLEVWRCRRLTNSLKSGVRRPFAQCLEF